MEKKCIYCSTNLSEDSVVDVCIRCGHQVWGEKMFQTIIDNMKSARESGDLDQGSITDSFSDPKLPGDTEKY